MNSSSPDRTATVDLLRRYDRPGPRYTSYPTVPMWNDTVTSEGYRDALRSAAQRTNEPLALYIHIPFCRRRCFYCACNTCVTHELERVDRYLYHLEREIDEIAGLLGKRRTVSQLHFGGGTPTFIGIEGLTRLLDKLRSLFSRSPTGEASIEVDPREVEPQTIHQLRELEFNRISFGVQDFDPVVQRAVGRIQSQERVQEILTAARDDGYTGINFDLIYGLPRQTTGSFAATIDTTINMRPDRIALYSFAYLPKLRANQEKINPEDLPDTETKYQLFSSAVQTFTGSGYRQIGMDHFALPEDELAIAQVDGRLHRNFMGYTVQSAPEMIGFGMSSIGYLNHMYVQNASDLESYQQRIAESSPAVYRGLRLSHDDRVRQYVITNLMCNFTVSFAELQSRFGEDYHSYFAEEDTELQPFIADGLLRRDQHGLAVTPLGRTFVRNIAMTFDAYLRDPSRKTTFSRTI